MPFEEKKVCREELMNSPPLSHCMLLMKEICEEINEDITSVRFAPKGISPHKMRKIIHNDKVIFKTRIACNR